MKRELSLVWGVALCAFSFGCSKADHEGTELSQTQTNFNTNALVVSAENLGRQINIAGTKLTNAAGEIREAAGAGLSEVRSFTDRLRASLQSDPAVAVDWTTIRFSQENEKIILSGTVRSEAERQAIVTKAREILGAEKFEDRLQVKPSGAATAPAPASESQEPSNEK